MQKIFRTLIIVAMLITSYLLILAWRDDYVTNAPQTVAAPVTHSATSDVPVATAGGDVPVVQAGSSADAPASSDELITVTTDRY